MRVRIQSAYLDLDFEKEELRVFVFLYVPTNQTGIAQFVQ
jgi:hypothetical protein